jgi:hypothetical protein
VATYVPLGSRPPKPFSADTSGLNPTNLSVSFSADDINCSVPFFEIEHYALNFLAMDPGVPSLVILSLYINTNLWEVNAISTVANGLITYTSDPHVAPTLRPGDSLTFAINVSESIPLSIIPLINFWLRYDEDIKANQSALLSTPQTY